MKYVNKLDEPGSSGSHVYRENYDLEYILNEIGGTFGRFQIWNFVMYSMGLCFCGMASMSYVFTAMNLEYRCVFVDCALCINYNIYLYMMRDCNS